MATIANIIGAELQDELCAEDSLDMTRLFQGGQQPIRANMVHNTREKQFAVRSGQWVLINHPTGSMTKMPKWFAESQKYESTTADHLLYDLENDLGQRINLSLTNKSKVRQMTALLESIQKAGHSAPRLTGGTKR